MPALHVFFLIVSLFTLFSPDAIQPSLFEPWLKRRNELTVFVADSDLAAHSYMKHAKLPASKTVVLSVDTREDDDTHRPATLQTRMANMAVMNKASRKVAALGVREGAAAVMAKTNLHPAYMGRAAVGSRRSRSAETALGAIVQGEGGDKTTLQQQRLGGGSPADGRERLEAVADGVHGAVHGDAHQHLKSATENAHFRYIQLLGWIAQHGTAREFNALLNTCA